MNNERSKPHTDTEGGEPMTDPRDAIRALVVRYLTAQTLPGEVLPEDYIDGIQVLFDSNLSPGRTVVADVLTADDGPDAVVLVQFDLTDEIIFAAYNFDGEAGPIPKEHYR